MSLSRRKKREARRKTVRAAVVAFENRENVHYTQGAARWSGIDNYRRAYKGQYPNYADCSAFTTWCFWDGCKEYINDGLMPGRDGDFVNNLWWKYGFTGTQIQNGFRVGLDDLKLADLIFYGRDGNGNPTHVAIYVGDGKVISHGSEGGPYLLYYNYRFINQARRYIK